MTTGQHIASNRSTRPPPPHPQSRRRIDATGAPFLLFVLVAGWAAVNLPTRVPVAGQHQAGALAARLLDRIDPNRSPWWELTALPRVGEVTARRIVAFRTEAQAAGTDPVFQKPADLQRVRGIGPKTVERLRPWLRFDR